MRRGTGGGPVAEVVNSRGEVVHVTDVLGSEAEAGDAARLWIRWYDAVPHGRVSSVYYILAVPELWAGPTPGSHRYSGLQVKIGTAKNVRRRVQNLRTGTSAALIVHALEPGGVEVERRRHEQFAVDRRQGEWFACSPALTRHMYQTWKRHNALPPEHQAKVVELVNKIDALKVVRDAMGGPPDMINPSLNEEWRGKILVDFLPPNGMRLD